MTNNLPIHVAKISKFKEGLFYLFLRKIDDICFKWYLVDKQENEVATDITGTTAEEAIKNGYLNWKADGFTTINCGFRYTLPERDEHGNNAYFVHMVQSYSSMNGIYFDADLGHNCLVNFASEEAKKLWKKLESK